MKRWLIILLLAVAIPARASNLWDNILSSTRATDWTVAGVKGGIPNVTNKCGATLTVAAVNGNASVISNALAGTGTGYTGCTTPYYIQLDAGTFTLTSGIQITKSNVVLRGMGADQTTLNFNVSSTGNLINCGIGYFMPINICPPVGTPFTTGSNWTAGYSQGTTSITLSSVAGLSAGGFVILDQQDDGSDGWPAAGDIYVCQTGPDLVCSVEGNANSGQTQSGRAETEMHEVSSISGMGPYTVNLVDGIKLPNWRMGQNPQASWINTPVKGVGIENLKVDWSTLEKNQLQSISAIGVGYAMDSWIKGVSVIETATTSYIHCPILNPIYYALSFRNTLQDSYIYGPSDNPVCVYQVRLDNDGDMLIQNNIIHQGNQPIYSGGAFSGSVVAYNFVPSVGVGGQTISTHGAGEFTNLFEGNIGTGVAFDSIHGSHFMQTQFRNRWSNPTDTSYSRNVEYDSTNSRFMNVVGNVLGDSSYTDYQYSCTSTSTCSYNDNAIYGMGFAGNYDGGIHVNYDTNVSRTIMRWGNWDSKTNAVRWCGSSIDSNWTSLTNCNSVSEIPSGITNFLNALPTIGDTGATPPMANMPASFYLSARPAWWVFPNSTAGLASWPGIGPEVTGGNIANTGGHAWLNPAANCYLNVLAGMPDGTGNPLNFSASNCYTGTQASYYMQGNFSDTSSGTTITVPYNSAQTAGDLNLIVVGWGDTTATVNSVTDTKGNAYTLAIGPTTVTGSLSQSIYYANNIVAAAAGANSVTVTFSQSALFPDIRITEYKTPLTGNPIDVTAASTGNSASSSSGSATTTSPNDIIVGANTVVTSTTGPGTGFIQRILSTPGLEIVEDETAATAGSYSATAPLNSSGKWIMQMVALKTSKSSRVRVSGPAASSRGILAGKAIAQ